MIKIDLAVSLSRLNPETAAKLIGELEEKGFYSNGSIACSDEHGKEVIEILDKYLLGK